MFERLAFALLSNAEDTCVGLVSEDANRSYGIGKCRITLSCSDICRPTLIASRNILNLLCNRSQLPLCSFNKPNLI